MLCSGPSAGTQRRKGHSSCPRGPHTLGGGITDQDTLGLQHHKASISAFSGSIVLDFLGETSLPFTHDLHDWCKDDTWFRQKSKPQARSAVGAVGRKGPSLFGLEVDWVGLGLGP